MSCVFWPESRLTAALRVAALVSAVRPLQAARYRERPGGWGLRLGTAALVPPGVAAKRPGKRTGRPART